MKVVLFCGGLGLRIAMRKNQFPSPWCRSATGPILWHVMKYLRPLRAQKISFCALDIARNSQDYFLNYNECASNDFVLSGGGKDLKLFEQ